MSKLLRPVLLPVAFFLLLTAEDCESPGSVEEEVAVLPDGSVETRFQNKAKDATRILDWDPPPSLEEGWDSVHMGLMRENKDDLYFLRAWTDIPPGADLPSSYAGPDDPLSDWYVRFPSELVTREQGDTVYFDYRRTYPSLPWSPMGLLKELEDEIESLEDQMEALEEENGGAFEEKWEDSGLLDQAEEEGDSTLLRQYQVEFKDRLLGGSPTPFEMYRRYYTGWIRLSLLSDLAFAIPAAEPFCRKGNSEATEALSSLVLGIVNEYEVPADLTWAAILEDADFDPDPAVFPNLRLDEFDSYGDSLVEELSAQKLSEMKEALHRECRLSADDRIEFDRRFAWLSERYHISDGEVRKQVFGFYLRMPGELVETNADTIVDGRAEWGFGIRDLFEDDVTVRATSRLIRRRP